ncbi:MAG TPA: SGNH hydrolase domain-containing protein [Baekduia sp.]|nr:SGNH hydrolase domain-containing protein [Baekduia sp.]
MPGFVPMSPTLDRRRGVVAVLAALAVLLAAGAPAARAQDPYSSADDPPCFGAAARDVLEPCVNRSLRTKVFPRPADAAIMPNSPCTPFAQTRVLLPCAFGVDPEAATATIGLVGDSHAAHWRAGVEVVAQAEGWHGISLTHASCAFSKAKVSFARPKRRACTRWNRATLRFLRRHREIDTLFVSDHITGSVIPKHGMSKFQTQVAGFIAAWRALPETIRHIVVIRDTPRTTHNSMSCVARAVRRHVPPGPACAVPRSFAALVDPATVAAHRWGSRRVDVVDMTPFFCSSRMCLPVIGGVLVHKDTTHLTQVFARTLGPYLQRAVEAAMRDWDVLPGGPNP